MNAPWATKALAEVCEFKPPKSEARSKLAAGDEVSFAPMEDLGIDEKYLLTSRNRRLDGVSGSYTYFADGDVLMAKITPCFENGKLGIARALTNGVGFGSSEYIVFRPSPSLDAEYLYYFLSRPNFREEGARRMSGAVGHKRVSKEFVEQCQIRMPPLGEQRRIVAILDEAFEGIATAKANAEKNLQNARDWADRQLATMLRSASEQGETSTLEGVAASGCSLSYGVVQPGGEVPGGMPVVRPVDLGARRVGLEGLKRMDPALARSYARTTLEGGDLLLCVRGTTGTVGVADMALAGANVTRGIVPIRFDPERIGQSMGFYLLRSEPVQAQIRAKTYGTALMQINIGDLRQIVFSFPPRAQQDALVEQLDAVQDAADRLAAVCERKLAALDELKKSLLHQAFSGAL